MGISRFSLLSRLFLLVCGLTLALSPTVSAAPILVVVPGLFNTGVDGTGSPQAVGSAELHWSLSGPTGSSVMVINPNAAWFGAAGRLDVDWPDQRQPDGPCGVICLQPQFQLDGHQHLKLVDNRTIHIG